MTAAEIAHALGGASRYGPGRYLARCPAHRDRTPSLSLADTEDGRLLWKCFGGCSQERVRDALRERGLLDRHRTRCAVAGPVKHHEDTAERRAVGLKLWHRRRPIEGTLAETYLREHRGICCPLPHTLGFLAGSERFPPAMIAAFGFAHEIEPGVLDIDEQAVMAIHLTKLTPDARKHPDDPSKIMLGRALGSPIVLAPMNELLGLAITEGIEDGLSVHAATGLGAWSAASANRMPALADAVPDYTDCVTVVADANEAGERNSALLAERLNARGIHAEIVPSAGKA